MGFKWIIQIEIGEHAILQFAGKEEWQIHSMKWFNFPLPCLFLLLSFPPLLFIFSLLSVLLPWPFSPFLSCNLLLFSLPHSLPSQPLSWSFWQRLLWSDGWAAIAGTVLSDWAWLGKIQNWDKNREEKRKRSGAGYLLKWNKIWGTQHNDQHTCCEWHWDACTTFFGVQAWWCADGWRLGWASEGVLPFPHSSSYSIARLVSCFRSFFILFSSWSYP